MIKRTKPELINKICLRDYISQLKIKSNSILNQSAFTPEIANLCYAKIKKFNESGVEFLDNCDPCSFGSDIDLTNVLLQDLINLYKTKRGKILESIPEENLCLFCGIESPKELDHYLPKKKYPTFSVEHNNLIRICNECNKKKAESFKDGDGCRLFFNSYYDSQPQNSYLICSIDFSFKPAPKIVFNLSTDSLSIPVCQIIRSHYQKLELIKRMNSSGSGILSDLLQAYENPPDEKWVKDKIHSYYKKFYYDYGMNHFQTVLYKVLIESFDDFYFFLKKQRLTSI